MRPILRSLPAALLALAVIAAPLPALAATSGAAQIAFDKAVEDAKAAMMADPEHALAKSEIAADRAARLPSSPEKTMSVATAQWLKGEAYIFSNHPDLAAPIVEQTLRTVERIAPQSKLRGDLLRSHGAIAAMSGRIQDALRDFQLAYAVFRSAKIARSQALTLQDIGLIYWDAGDYARVLRYYSQAGELYTTDPAFTLTSHNNRGEVLIKLGRPQAAVREFMAALGGARALKSPLLQVRVLSNLASAQVEAGNTARASDSIAQAMRLSRAGEAAGWKPFVLGAAAKVANARGDYAQAGALLQQAFAGADLARTQMPFREFHELASNVYQKLGNDALALAHLRAFQRLDGEARNLTASTSAQLMGARFDFSNQNLKIAQLKQAQLAADIRFRTILFSGLGGAGAIVLGLLLIGFLSLRRSRNEVRQANTVLTGVNAQLEKALKAKTDFLATTSHEIRTPLNGILGMTQILLANRTVKGELREQLEVVHGAGENMKALVDDILDLAKMETGNVATVAETVDVRALLKDAAFLWSGHAAAKGLALTLDIDDIPRHLVTDGGRLRQILFNLLSNAVKFTAAGSIGLAARVDGAGDAAALAITISDTGVGIPDDQQALVFEAFHQVDGGTTRQFGGTGLGLAICRNLARSLGGNLDLRSAIGIGSSFTLRLPLVLADRMPHAVEREAHVRPATLAAATLLVVEGNGLAQGMLRALFEADAAQIVMVGNGDDALVELARGRIDHLLVEAKSAAIGDASLLASLRRLVEAADEAGVSSTILFAPADDLPVADVAQCGATQLVMKPVGGRQLVQSLREGFAPGGGPHAPSLPIPVPEAA